MKATRLTTDWNAEPNVPDVKLSVDDNIVTLDFYLNAFRYTRFKEDDRAKLKFKNCHKYSFNTMNDEGYYMGQYRYKDIDLPWGEFYKLNSDWRVDFPVKHEVLSDVTDPFKLNHYIFFFRDNTFECVAESYEIEFD